MGEGVIGLRRLRGWVEARGYAGYGEVEIFSHRWWQPTGHVPQACVERHHQCA